MTYYRLENRYRKFIKLNRENDLTNVLAKIETNAKASFRKIEKEGGSSKTSVIFSKKRNYIPCKTKIHQL